MYYFVLDYIPTKLLKRNVPLANPSHMLLSTQVSPRGLRPLGLTCVLNSKRSLSNLGRNVSGRDGFSRQRCSKAKFPNNTSIPVKTSSRKLAAEFQKMEEGILDPGKETVVHATTKKPDEGWCFRQENC